MTNVVLRLQEFIEDDAGSCSMDFGCVNHCMFTGCGMRMCLSMK